MGDFSARSPWKVFAVDERSDQSVGCNYGSFVVVEFISRWDDFAVDERSDQSMRGLISR